MAVAATLLALVSAVSCNRQEKETELVVVLDIPAEVTVDSGDMEISFRVVGSMAPEAGDMLELEGKTSAVCGFTSVTSRYVYAVLPDGFASGTYKVYVSRGTQKKLMGETVIFVDYAEAGDIILEEGNNVYGKVTCDGQPVAEAVVSDGAEAVSTDEDGVYQFKSGKENGYVFISVPSGYTVKDDGVLPQFYSDLAMGADVAERVDFELVKDDGQDSYTVLVFGDMHLADRSNNDRSQFASFTSDINQFITANGGRKLYAVTLGDMTWDLYWYSNNYCFKEYLNDVSAIKGLPIYHSIGNHDHDMNASGDFDTAAKYREYIGPTYYSFNIGDVHYVILDDILCTNKGDGSRTYDTSVTSGQLEWLRKDLSFVSPGTTLFIAMHAPLYTNTGSYSLDNSAALESIVSAFSEVHFFTGHTHKVYNVDKTSSKHIFEHNAGAVCATWWWSAAHTPGVHIGQDGAPGGYTVLDVDGDDFTWKFKATGIQDTYQFRTYDRNCISITADKYIPGAYPSNKTRFNGYAVDWSAASSSNEVYLNVWNYDPEWSIQVTENGKELPVESLNITDPLHLIAYTAPAMSSSTKDVTPTFPTYANRHMFRVKAGSATSTLEIKVTDRFGNAYHETMTRPKAFTVDNYRH